MVSHWLAWIAFGLSILLLLKFAARKSKIKKINRIFSKSHITFAVIMMVTGLTHGTILIIKSTSHITAIISGLFLFGSALFVCLTCMHRRRHKKTWMRMHRIGSVILGLLLLTHLFFVFIFENLLFL